MGKLISNENTFTDFTYLNTFFPLHNTIKKQTASRELKRGCLKVMVGI